MKRSWLHSATFQPMNGQPVWTYVPARNISLPAVYEWVEFGKYPFRWRMEGGDFFLGHGLWQPRLDGEMPEPPPAEKPKTV